MREILNLNYGIYEYDILDLGGEIQWSGRVVSKMRHSVLEDAVIILGDIHCEARFERYDFGNAAICCFLENGIQEKDNEAHADTANSKRFLHKYVDICQANDVFLEFQFTRRLKQYGTLVLQILCAVTILAGIRFLFNPYTLIRGSILIIGNIILLFILSSFYKYHRLMRLSQYKPWFFAKEDKTK